MYPSKFSSSRPTAQDVRLARFPIIRAVARYISDYVLLGAIAFGSHYVGTHVKPVMPPFSLTDPSLSFPFTPDEDDTISSLMLFLISGGVPALAIIILGLLPQSPASWMRKLANTHTMIIGLIMSIALSTLFTEGLKNVVGKPRPDFLARCQPDLSLLSSSSTGFHLPESSTLVTHGICAQSSQDILYNGFRSFLSVHASISFAGLAYLSLLLASRLSIWDTSIRNGRAARRFDVSRPVNFAVSTLGAWRAILVILPLCGALFISAIRVTDFKHHPIDVSLGTAVGLIAALFSFRFYFAGLDADHGDSVTSGGLPTPGSLSGKGGFSNGHIGGMKGHTRLASDAPSMATVIIARQPEYELEMGGLRTPGGFSGYSNSSLTVCDIERPRSVLDTPYSYYPGRF